MQEEGKEVCPRPVPPPACLRPRTGFRFQSQARRQRSGADAQGREGLASPPGQPMAPTAFWAALAVGLQFWAAGRAVARPGR